MPLLLLILIITGCGKPGDIQDTRKVQSPPFEYKLDSELVPYYDRFQAIYGEDITYISGSFGDTKTDSDNKAIGLCYSYSEGSRQIIIDRDYWEKITDNGKEQLIFHEAGHCHFNLEHDSTMLDLKKYGKIPASIMYPVHFGNNDYYEEFKEYYHKELKP